MEKEKKIDVKIIVIVVVVIIAIVSGIFILVNTKGLSASKCIGKWDEENSIDIKARIVLYEGGTGKYYYSIEDEEENTNDYDYLNWEIKDNILNIKRQTKIVKNVKMQGTKITNYDREIEERTTGYKIENDTMTSLDGKRIYHKVK